MTCFYPIPSGNHIWKLAQAKQPILIYPRFFFGAKESLLVFLPAELFSHAVFSMILLFSVSQCCFLPYCLSCYLPCSPSRLLSVLPKEQIISSFVHVIVFCFLPPLCFYQCTLNWKLCEGKGYVDLVYHYSSSIYHNASFRIGTQFIY